MTDINGNITATYDYYPYGGSRIEEEVAGETDRRFTGHELDEETDLTYAGARYYAAGVGRFIQVDPIAQNVASSKRLQEVLVEPQRLNEYSYALNNPVKYVDPDGQYVETAADLIAVAFSLRDAAMKGTIGSGVWLGLDAIALVVPIPAIGNLRHGAKIAKALNYFEEVATKAGKVVHQIAETFVKNIFFKQNQLKFSVGTAGDSLANLVGHFEKHQTQFGVKNVREYYDRANDFVSKNTFDNKDKFFSWAEGTDTVFYNRETKELLAKTSNNEIKSYQIVNTDEKLTKVNNRVAEIKAQQNGQ